MIKSDCFAYINAKRPQCNALNVLYCATGECAFYKPKEQNDAEMLKYNGTKSLKDVIRTANFKKIGAK
jgi:phage FluMu protein Com